MLIRYKTSENGKLVKQAEVFTKKEHGINAKRLDVEAVKIVRRLQKAGHEAYIVGGAVRDLLMGKIPKDFDISTSAEPSQIRKLFRNSRVIGKRFRLVHIFFRDKKIIEVSTFRSVESQGFQAVFGEIEEDALRRDFSMNALYFDPVKEQVIDFVHGLSDIRSGKLKAVIPHKRIFVEDPVRIIRAIKYSVKTGLQPGYLLRRRMKKQVGLLEGISYSRLTEEIYKILAIGEAAEIFRQFDEYGVTRYILPGLDAFLQGKGPEIIVNRDNFFGNLKTLDDMVHTQREVPRGMMIQQLVRDYVMRLGPWVNQKRIHFPEVYSGIKELLKPMVPANKDVEDVVVNLMRERQDAMGQRSGGAKSRRRRSRPRRKKPVHSPAQSHEQGSKDQSVKDQPSGDQSAKRETPQKQVPKNKSTVTRKSGTGTPRDSGGSQTGGE